MTRARIVWPTLIAMCGLPFAGKSVLATSLSHELGIRLLSYDFEIYLPHRHLVPPGSSVAAEYDFVQDIGHRQIGAFLAAGESLIYDDLLLERDDRRKLAAVAHHHRADFVLVYLDTPLEVIGQRQAENARTRTRHSVPEADMRLDASLLEPPDPAEQAISVRPGDDLTDVLTRITASLGRGGQASVLPDRGWFVTTVTCLVVLRLSHTASGVRVKTRLRHIRGSAPGFTTTMEHRRRWDSHDGASLLLLLRAGGGFRGSGGRRGADGA
ncbi:MAG: AAA family ATPase [Streptosporangiaceae bacterium]